MSQVYEIHTNEGNYLVHGVSTKQIRARMIEYTREKLKKGYRLSEVIYCWGRRDVSRRLP